MTADSLRIGLDTLFALGIVRADSTRPLLKRLFDRIVGPGLSQEVPVFDEALLGQVIQTLGD